MKKKRKGTNKLNDEQSHNKFTDFVRAMERGRCINELEGVLKDIDLIELVQVDFPDDAGDYDLPSISLGVKWAIARLKGKSLGDDNE